MLAGRAVPSNCSRSTSDDIYLTSFLPGVEYSKKGVEGSRSKSASNREEEGNLWTSVMPGSRK